MRINVLEEAYARAKTWPEAREVEDPVKRYMSAHPGSPVEELEIICFEDLNGAYTYVVRRKLDENSSS